MQVYWGLVLLALLVFGGWLWLRASGRSAIQASSLQPVLTRQTSSPKKLIRVCRKGEKRPCYTGRLGTNGVGLCKAGHQVCVGGRFGSCVGQHLPAKSELCDGKDNDCNGQVDEPFASRGKPCSVRRNGILWRGRYQCSKDRTQLVCHPIRLARVFPILEVRPRHQRFRIKFGGRVRRVRGRLHLKIRRRTRVKIERRGYYACYIRVSPRQKRLFLYMRRRDPNSLAPLDSYCLKRR